MSTLYNRIEALCGRKSITITQMCKDAGVSRASLTDLKMNRKQSLSSTTLSKIASYFGVTVDYLLCSETKKSSPGTDDSAEAALDEELIRRLALLTPEEAAKVDAFVQGILAAR